MMKVSRREAVGYAVGAVVSVALVVAALGGQSEFTLTEVLGFISGALCVWLTVKQSAWNFPVSIANNIFFIILFLQARLFADTSLQGVYIVLELLGWYWWLRGGTNRSALAVQRTSAMTGMVLAALTLAGTAGLTIFLGSVNDSAPFWDALTTVLSLVAQYMLTRKILENWFVWMVADVIYVGLYISKGLYLTAVLYALFFAMCIAGTVAWRAAYRKSSTPGHAVLEPAVA